MPNALSSPRHPQKIHLRLDVPRPRLKMIWTRRPDGVLACGPVTIEYMNPAPEREKHCWYTLVNGVVACRCYGYTREREAMAAAPHLSAVKLLMKGK